MKSNNLKMEYLQSRHKQQGAVLFISLMILLVLTMIGVSSLNGSLMEEKMAANAQTSTTIFQEAESAIKTAYYQEKLKPDLAFKRAQNRYSVNLPPHTPPRGGTTTGGTTTTGDTTTTGGTTTTGDTTTEEIIDASNFSRNAQLVFPEERVKTRLFNSSAGTFVARGIEIVGTASLRGITESNTQGYSVYPMRP